MISFYVEIYSDSTVIRVCTVKVEGEKNYHLRVAAILGEVEAEVSFTQDCLLKKSISDLIIYTYVMAWILWQLVSEKQRKESAPPVIPQENGSEKTMYFLAEVCYFSYPGCCISDCLIKLKVLKETLFTLYTQINTGIYNRLHIAGVI